MKTKQGPQEEQIESREENDDDNLRSLADSPVHMIEIAAISKGEQWCSSTVKGKEKENEEINGGHDKNNGGDGGCCEEDGTRSPEEGGGQAETKVLDEAEVQAEKAIDGVSSTATTAATTAQSVKAADVIVQ